MCFAWNSDETLHDQDVKVSVEGSKWPNWPTGQWKCFKRNLPIFIFGTSAWKSLEDEGARCTLTLSEAFSGFAKSVFGLNSVVTKQCCTQSQISAEMAESNCKVSSFSSTTMQCIICIILAQDPDKTFFGHNRPARVTRVSRLRRTSRNCLFSQW